MGMQYDQYLKLLSVSEVGRLMELLTTEKRMPGVSGKERKINITKEVQPLFEAYIEHVIQALRDGTDTQGLLYELFEQYEKQFAQEKQARKEKEEENKQLDSHTPPNIFTLAAYSKAYKDLLDGGSKIINGYHNMSAVPDILINIASIIKKMDQIDLAHTVDERNKLCKQLIELIKNQDLPDLLREKIKQILPKFGVYVEALPVTNSAVPSIQEPYNQYVFTDQGIRVEFSKDIASMTALNQAYIKASPEVQKILASLLIPQLDLQSNNASRPVISFANGLRLYFNHEKVQALRGLLNKPQSAQDLQFILSFLQPQAQDRKISLDLAQAQAGGASDQCGALKLAILNILDNYDGLRIEPTKTSTWTKAQLEEKLKAVKELSQIPSSVSSEDMKNAYEKLAGIFVEFNPRFARLKESTFMELSDKLYIAEIIREVLGPLSEGTLTKQNEVTLKKQLIAVYTSCTASPTDKMIKEAVDPLFQLLQDNIKTRVDVNIYKACINNMNNILVLNDKDINYKDIKDKDIKDKDIKDKDIKDKDIKVISNIIQKIIQEKLQSLSQPVLQSAPAPAPAPPPALRPRRSRLPADPATLTPPAPLPPEPDQLIHPAPERVMTPRARLRMLARIASTGSRADLLPPIKGPKNVLAPPFPPSASNTKKDELLAPPSHGLRKGIVLSPITDRPNPNQRIVLPPITDRPHRQR